MISLSKSGLHCFGSLFCLATVFSFCCYGVYGDNYKFVLFWPKPGVAASANDQFRAIFRDKLTGMCAANGVAMPTNLEVTFEEFLLPSKPSFELLNSYAANLSRISSSPALLFAGTTSTDARTRSQLASLMSPSPPVHWVDPPPLASLSLSLFRIIRTMQRPDLAAATGVGPGFSTAAETGSTAESKKLVVAVGPPYTMADLQPLLTMFSYGVRCFAVNMSTLYKTLTELRDSKITTVLVVANRTAAKEFLLEALDTILWSPDYRWILYDSALIYEVRPNLMSTNSRNITTIEFGPYVKSEFKYLSTIENVLLYDLLNIWTVYLANATCATPINNSTVDGLTGQFVLSSSSSFSRKNWRLNVYGNLLTKAIVIGNFSTDGDLNMSVPQPRLNDRESVLSDYRKLNLSVLVIPGSQYVRYKEGMQNRTDLPLKDRLEGLSFDLCMEVLDNLGLKNVKVYEQADGVYGALDVNGDWSGIVGSLVDGVGDLACVDLTPNSARMAAIDFTKSYFTTNMSILYKQNAKDATKEMFQFMYPFNSTTWFYLLGAMLIFAIVLAVLHRISPNRELFDIRYSLFLSFASLFQGIVGKIPDRPSGRIVVGTYWLFVLILLVSYVGNYAAMRTLARLEVDITTVASLLDQTTYTYGTLSNSSFSTVFEDSTFSDMRRLFSAMRRFPNGLFTSTDTAINLVRSGTFAAILDTPSNMYSQQLICGSVVTGYFENSETAFGLPKGSDLKNVIDEELVKLLAAGRFKQLYNKYFIVPQSSKPSCVTNPLSGIIPTEPETLAPRSGALTLQNTLGLLIVNVIGCCLTLLAAGCERIFVYAHQMRAKKREEALPKKRQSVIAGLFRMESRV